MGINLTEISQKVLDVVKNGANIYRKMYDLHYNPTPMDVPMEYVDENGVKRTTNIPNVANFRKRVWDDVGGALGQFERTLYVDQAYGNDNNDGSYERPLKSIRKAVDATPNGATVRIRLLAEHRTSLEPGSTYFNGKNVVLEIRNNTLIHDGNNLFRCPDSYGYVKIYSGNGYSGILQITTATDLIRGVDSICDVTIGDHDSDLTVDFVGNFEQTLVNCYRSRMRIHAIRTSFSGNGTSVCKIVGKDYDFVDVVAHASCEMKGVIVSKYNETSIVRNSCREGKVRAVHIDPISGNDANSGIVSAPLKTFSELVRRLGYFRDKKIDVYVHSDLVVDKWLSIINAYIEIKPFDNTNPPVVVFKSQDGNGDGVFVQSVNLYKSTLIVRCPVRFENQNSSSGINSNIINVAYGSTFIVNSYDGDAYITVEIGDYANAILCGNGNVVRFWKCNFSFGSNSSRIVAGIGTFDVGVVDCKIDDNILDAKTFASHCVGIVKDLNGIPRNFTSNIIL